MEYSINELDDAIFNYLVTYTPNEWVSANKIFNEICEKNICPSLKNKQQLILNKRLFMSECRTLNTKFNKIDQKKVGKTIYLKFDVVSLVEEEEFLTYEQICDDAILKLTISEELVKPFMQEGDTVKNSTLLHEICRTCDLTTFKKIKNYITVDIYFKDKFGDTLVDVIDLTNENGILFLKELLIFNENVINNQTKKIKELNDKIYSTTKEKLKLYDDINELKKENALNKPNNNIYVRKLSDIIAQILIVVFVGAIVCLVLLGVKYGISVFLK